MARVFEVPARDRLFRQSVILAVDGVVAALGLGAAMMLRFDTQIPAAYGAGLPRAMMLIAVLRLFANALAGLHCWSYRFSGLPDAVRIIGASVAGSALFIALSPSVAARGMPRTVYALEFFMSASAFATLRFGPRVALRWWDERRRVLSGAAATLIVGEDTVGELLARDIERNPRSPYRVVGFVGSNPSAIGRRLDGRPILGLVEDMAQLIARHRIEMVLLAIPRGQAASLREIIAASGSSQVRFRILPVNAETDRISASMLDDLAPEDLLRRDPVEFDRGELRRFIDGRRAMVTGAGGSIGGEICRQLIQYGVSQLVMVDMNENELYLSARRFAAQEPKVDVRAEVADLREPNRVARLGDRYRPELVFHAAAHKHVPLMEDAPEEAVKNNVFGTLNVARMADACGASRFVLISTDKAVNPTSVMGATKRIAELVVRDLARTSRMNVTAVRFGNVLGSAGSVVPLFKEQIARGGPVTVTHPDCTRYFMTIPEAVGLVLVAGLGDFGELCLLDMGEPVNVEELARLMIALSGRVADRDVKIVYTGLRAGEKLTEELLTEEEEKTHAVRDRIRIARSPAPPHDLRERLEELRRLSEYGDAEAILRAIEALVPSYSRRGSAKSAVNVARRAVEASSSRRVVSFTPRDLILPAPPEPEPA